MSCCCCDLGSFKWGMRRECTNSSSLPAGIRTDSLAFFCCIGLHEALVRRCMIVVGGSSVLLLQSEDSELRTAMLQLTVRVTLR